MSTSHFIPTRCSMLNKKSGTEADFKFVKFEAHKPKKKEKKDVTDSAMDQARAKLLPQNSTKELDLKKIAHEITKFGISGFDAPKKEQAKIALAISLGAKPPKKDYLNYKELMENRKEEKIKEKEAIALKNLGRDLSGKPNVSGGRQNKRKSKNNVGDVLNVYGKVKKKDLPKTKSSNTEVDDQT